MRHDGPVSNGWVVVLVTLAAALAFATSSALKHVSAGQAPDAGRMHPRALARFVTATLSNRYWLGGIAADVVGLSLQLVALHRGALGVVQPLLLTGLLFALLLRGRSQGRISGREIGWACVVIASLAGFLALAGTAGSVLPTDGIDRKPAVAAAVVGAALAVVCVALGRRATRQGRSAALLGIAVGAVYATTAALLKALTSIALEGIGPLLTSWQLYVVVVLGAAGLLLNQLAFQAGPLNASLPAIATVDPLLSIAIGVIVYDEQVRQGVPAALGLGALLLVLGVAVIALVRTEPAPAEPAFTPRPATGTGSPWPAAAPQRPPGSPPGPPPPRAARPR